MDVKMVVPEEGVDEVEMGVTPFRWRECASMANASINPPHLWLIFVT